MLKETLVERYTDFITLYNLAPSECLLSASGAMLMLGLRNEVDDIDLDISEATYDSLKAAGFNPIPIKSPISKELLEYDGYITLHKLESSFNAMNIEKDFVIVDGVGCYSPKAILRQKEMLNRKKDRKDIEVLRSLVMVET